MQLNAEQLRKLEEERARGMIREISHRPIYFILEDIYDTYNIGGLFRLADALAIEKMFLVGETETPPNSRIKKASIGTYKIVNWQYCQDTKEAVKSITYNIERRTFKKNKMFDVSRSKLQIIAVEQHPKSIVYTQAKYSLPLALIFGNESYGIRDETLKLVNQIVEIPMWGVNKSLNVIVAASIVSYWIAAKLY